MKKLALPLFLLALLVAPVASRAVAKDAPVPGALVGTKTVGVLAITSYDELLKDLAFLGDLSGNPGLDQQLDGMLKFFTQGQGLNGLDTARPWGAVVQTDDVQFQPFIFLPVKDMGTLFKSLGPLIGGEPTDKGDGVYELMLGGQSVYAKEVNGWAILAQTTDALATAPTDAPKQISKLTAHFDLAIMLNVQNVPEMYRNMAIDQLRTGIEQNTAQQPDESDEDYANRKKLIEAQVEQMVTSINETQDLALGWKIDREARSTHIDLRMTGVPGTRTAAQLARMQDMPSDFSGFISPSAAGSFNFVAEVAKEDLEQQLTQLESAKSNVLNQIDGEENLGDQATRDALKTVVNDLFAAFVATAKAGKIDAGVSVMLGEKEMSVVGGALIVEPKKVEDSIKKLAELGKKDPNFPEIKYDALTHKGIRFHTLTVPVPADQDISRVVGDKIDVAVGFGAKHVYIAMGTDNISKVKEAVDKSVADRSKKYPPARLTLSLAQILRFASTVSEEPMAGALADELEQSEQKDHIIVTLRSAGSEGTVFYRLTAEEGVLKLIGQLSRLTGGAGPPGGFGN